MVQKEIQIKVLGGSEIDEACHLLYDIYIVNLQWRFLDNNPSELKIKEVAGKKYLVDRFIDKSIWFGAIYNNQIIGCCRLTSIDENNELEIEGYTNLIVGKFIPPNIKSSYFELSKLAVKKQYACYKIAKKLILASFKYSLKQKKSIFANTHNAYLIRLFNEIEYPLKYKNLFKYEHHDKKAVNFYLADYNSGEVEKVYKRLKGS